MKVKNIWMMVKNRYRLSTKVQMSFEMSFPKYLIGKSRFITQKAHEIRTHKVSLSQKGIVLSDTIPLSWFTSSALIPWENVLKIAVSETAPSIDGSSNASLSSRLDKQTVDAEYCTLQLNDPQDMTIELPWSKEFTDYLQRHKLFDI